jgi:hypothetical protein
MQTLAQCVCQFRPASGRPGADGADTLVQRLEYLTVAVDELDLHLAPLLRDAIDLRVDPVIGEEGEYPAAVVVQRVLLPPGPQPGDRYQRTVAHHRPYPGEQVRGDITALARRLALLGTVVAAARRLQMPPDIRAIHPATQRHPVTGQPQILRVEVGGIQVVQLRLADPAHPRSADEVGQREGSRRLVPTRRLAGDIHDRRLPPVDSRC